MPDILDAIIIDTETTGIDEPHLIEYGEMTFRDPLTETLEVKVRRFKPGKPISFGAMAAHGIIDADLADEAPHTDFTPTPAKYIIGHNIDFDWKVIGSPDVKRICTLALARDVWPDLDSHKLLAIAFMLDPVRAQVWHKTAHGVATDIEMTYFLVEEIIAKLEPKSVGELWRMSEERRVPKTMQFGKFKGLTFDKVPGQYARWYLGTSDADPYVVQAFKAAGHG